MRKLGASLGSFLYYGVCTLLKIEFLKLPNLVKVFFLNFHEFKFFWLQFKGNASIWYHSHTIPQKKEKDYDRIIEERSGRATHQLSTSK